MATPSDFTGTTTTKTLNMVIYDDHHIDLLYQWVSHAICVYISLPWNILYQTFNTKFASRRHV